MKHVRLVYTGLQSGADRSFFCAQDSELERLRGRGQLRLSSAKLDQSDRVEAAGGFSGTI